MSDFQCVKCGIVHTDNGKGGYSLHRGRLKIINTFEDLAEKLNTKIRDGRRRSIYIKISKMEIIYFDDNTLKIRPGYFSGQFKNVNLRQAYNIITAFKENIDD